MEHIGLFVKCRLKAFKIDTKAGLGLKKEEDAIVGEWEWLRKFYPSTIALSINSTFSFFIIEDEFY